MARQLQRCLPASAGSRWHILVVAGDQTEVIQYREALGGEGYRLSEVSTATQAMQTLRQEPTDMVIVDLSVPDAGGMGLLAHVREMYPDTCVLVVADSSGVEDAVGAMRRGAADFLTKPFEAREVRRVVGACLKALSEQRDQAFASQSQAMLELTRMLAEPTGLHALPTRALELACANFGADSALLLADEAADGRLSVVAHAGNLLGCAGFGREMSLRGTQALREGKVITAADPRNGDCYAFAPLQAAGESSGVLCLRRAGGPWFNEKSLEFLQMFALHLAISLRTASLHDAAAQQVADLEELAAEGRILSLATDPERLRARLLKAIRRAVGAQIGAILTAEDGELRLYTLPELAPGSPLFEAVRDRLAALMGHGTYASGPPSGTHSELASFLSAEIRADGQKVGIVAALDSRPNRFSLEEAQRLSLIAESASAAACNRAALARVSVLYQESMEVLAQMADARCPDHSGHSSQVRTFASRLARAIGISGRELYRIEDGALLHDVGKLRIAESLLNKPAPLSTEEFAAVAAHAAIGAEILQRAPHLRDLAPIVRHHHENYDGTGYPDRLKGEHIPLGARITGLADAFDALISHRAYREGVSIEEARRILAENAGRQFDPELVKAFLARPLEAFIEH